MRIPTRRGTGPGPPDAGRRPRARGVRHGQDAVHTGPSRAVPPWGGGPQAAAVLHLRGYHPPAGIPPRGRRDLRFPQACGEGGGLVEEVFIASGTPGVATEVGPATIAVSFEPGDCSDRLPLLGPGHGSEIQALGQAVDRLLRGAGLRQQDLVCREGERPGISRDRRGIAQRGGEEEEGPPRETPTLTETSGVSIEAEPAAFRICTLISRPQFTPISLRSRSATAIACAGVVSGTMMANSSPPYLQGISSS